MLTCRTLRPCSATAHIRRDALSRSSRGTRSAPSTSHSWVEFLRVLDPTSALSVALSPGLKQQVRQSIAPRLMSLARGRRELDCPSRRRHH